MGKEEGEVAGCDCYSPSFISMLVCLLFISKFLSFSFCLLDCLFPSSSLLKGTSLVWLCLYTPVSPSVPEMEGIYATGGILF